MITWKSLLGFTSGRPCPLSRRHCCLATRELRYPEFNFWSAALVIQWLPLTLLSSSLASTKKYRLAIWPKPPTTTSYLIHETSLFDCESWKFSLVTAIAWTLILSFKLMSELEDKGGGRRRWWRITTRYLCNYLLKEGEESNQGIGITSKTKTSESRDFRPHTTNIFIFLLVSAEVVAHKQWF